MSRNRRDHTHHAEGELHEHDRPPLPQTHDHGYKHGQDHGHRRREPRLTVPHEGAGGGRDHQRREPSGRWRERALMLLIRDFLAHEGSDAQLWAAGYGDAVPPEVIRVLAKALANSQGLTVVPLEPGGYIPYDAGVDADRGVKADYGPSVTAHDRQGSHGPSGAAQTRISRAKRWLRRAAWTAAGVTGVGVLLFIVWIVSMVVPAARLGVEEAKSEAAARSGNLLTQAQAQAQPAANVLPLDAHGLPYEPGTIPDRTTGEFLSETEQQIVVSAVRERGIRLKPEVAGKRPTPFVVFSDPSCPHCRQFDETLHKLDDNYLPVIVPVAFRPGSEEVVAKIFCAPDRTAAWKRAVAGLPLTNATCPAGEAAVIQANGDFIALRLRNTPSYVGPAGNVASGAASLTDLLTWVNASSHTSAERRAANAAAAPAAAATNATTAAEPAAAPAQASTKAPAAAAASTGTASVPAAPARK